MRLLRTNLCRGYLLDFELPYTLPRFDHCGQNDSTYWRNIIHSYNQHLKAMNESYWIDTININHGREKTLSTWLTKIWSS